MFWSPDGREIAFFSEGKLKRIGADGGPSRRSARAGADSSARGVARARSSSRRSSALPSSPSPRREARLGRSRRSTRRGAKSRTSIPTFLPDGRHFVFVARNIDPEKTSVCSPRSIRRTSAGSSTRIPPPCSPIPATFSSLATTPLFAWKIRSPKPEARRRARSRARAGPLRDRGQPPVGLGGRETAWPTCRGSCGEGSSGWIERDASSARSAKSGVTRTFASRRTAGRSP